MKNDNGYKDAKNSFPKSDKNNASQIELFNSANKNNKGK